MKQSAFVQQLRKKFVDDYEIGGDDAIAGRLGVSPATVRNWSKSDKELEAFQVANALIKAQTNAVATAQYETIRPIVEFYAIECSDSRHGAKLEILPSINNSTKMQLGVRQELARRNGLYIFYDSRGRALYAGKARKQNLWKEINLAFNRSRDEVQKIMLVPHPERQQAFKPAYEKPRQPSDTILKLHELSTYFSAYWIADAMIDDLEALLVRGFANDLLNIRMERFKNLG